MEFCLEGTGRERRTHWGCRETEHRVLAGTGEKGLGEHTHGGWRRWAGASCENKNP